MKHETIEKNVGLLMLLMVLAVSIGGLTQIVPLFFQDVTNKPVEGMKPYTALQLEGRDIYIREGCVQCHSQMIRPFRAETERYGHYSVAGESVWDHPFLWGSKRTGPDLARVGAKYSDEWHVTHLSNPRAIVPQSVMPGYRFLADTEVNLDQIAGHLRTNRAIGVPYSEDQILNAVADLKTQTDPDSAEADAFAKRYPKAVARNFDGKAGAPTEMDALVAYLQMLGTLVDFKLYNEKANLR